MKNIIKALFLITIIITSCNNNNLDYHTFPNNRWKESEKIKFTREVNDSTKDYSLNIDLRHTTSYQYNNIRMFLHHHYKNKKINTDTIEIKLAEINSGKWIGLGKNDIKEHTYFFEKKKYKKGSHVFELELAMREVDNLQIEELENIRSIIINLKEE